MEMEGRGRWTEAGRWRRRPGDGAPPGLLLGQLALNGHIRGPASRRKANPGLDFPVSSQLTQAGAQVPIRCEKA